MMAYALAYDGWKEAFRRSVMERFVAFSKKDDKGYTMNLENLALKPKCMPATNKPR